VATRTSRGLLCVTALVGLGLVGSWTEPAAAQATATDPVLNANEIERVDPSYISRRVRRYWVNYAECIANDSFSFPLTLRSQQSLEVWVGNDNCAEKRGLDDHGQCWIVANYEPTDLSLTQTVIVPVRNVINRNLDADMAPTNLGTDVCTNNTDEDGEQLTFYFFHEEGGKAVGTTSWNNSTGAIADGTGYDLVGPNPPSAIEVGFGESQLSIELDGVVEDEDRERFEAFCVPTTGEGAALGDAGGAVAADASADAATDPDVAAPSACSTQLMRAGERPPLGYSCGLAGETSRKLSTGTLENNVVYAVGVAGQDLVGNAGVLSPIACGRPIVLDDFFEVYSRSGGKGGGGFCAVAEPGRPAKWYWLPSLGLLGLGWLARRARRAA
jgi:hypothetical protein